MFRNKIVLFYYNIRCWVGTRPTPTSFALYLFVCFKGQAQDLPLHHLHCICLCVSKGRHKTYPYIICIAFVCVFQRAGTKSAPTSFALYLFVYFKCKHRAHPYISLYAIYCINLIYNIISIYFILFFLFLLFFL